MPNEKLKLKLKVASIDIPEIAIDLTANDAAEHLLENAIVIADFGDANPGDGDLDIKAAIKVKGVTIPITIQLGVA